jgi:hypothetical protein
MQQNVRNVRQYIPYHSVHSAAYLFYTVLRWVVGFYCDVLTTGAQYVSTNASTTKLLTTQPQPAHPSLL